jgi:hypothetical protein
MNFVGHYFLTLCLLLIFAFMFWLLMQKNSEKEITYLWLATIGFWVSIFWILYGVYSVFKFISSIIN